MSANKDCKIEPRSQQFLLFDKLHVLGAVFGPAIVDPVSGVNVFQTLGPSNYNNAIPHGIYNMIAIHSDSHPTKGIMNTIDNWSISHQEYGVEAETKIYKMNTSYLDDIKYSSTDKSQEYLETKYIKASTFYEIPTQNILSAGIIKNKVEDKWDLCLIDEGNEKCNYTLEARLFTHGEIDSEVDTYSASTAGIITGLEGLDNYVFYNTGDNADYPSYGYFLGMIGVLPAQEITSNNLDIVNKYKAEVATQHYYIFDEYNRHYDELPVCAKPSPQWYGWQTNKFDDSQVFHPVNTQTLLRYKDLRDINPNNIKYQTTHFNFFTNQKNSMLANKFACNQDFAVGRYPGTVVVKGQTEPFPADNNYNIADGYVGGTEPNRYYLCYNQYIDDWHNARNEPPYRYLGSVLSNPNAYTDLLMMHNGGQIVSGFNWYDIVDAYHATGTTVNTINRPCNSGKQTNECLAGIPGQGAYASNAAGEALYKTSLKSGCNKLQFNFNTDITSYTFTHGTDIGDISATNFSRQGYLYDRDVMLFAPAPDSYNSNDWNNNSAAPEGTYLGNMIEETELYDPATGTAVGPGVNVPTEASEIEFELFYCANINTPTAAMTLLEFGKKLNKKISNFDTKIFNHAIGWYAQDWPGVDDNNHVHIRPLEDFSTASIIYGSKTQIDSSVFVEHGMGQSNNIEESGGINIIPTVEINNVYIWENGGAPYKGSKKLEGTKTTLYHSDGGNDYKYELYSYGEYFIAYFAHKLFLIDKITFDRYMYDAEEFTELIQELAYNPCASDYSGTNKKYSDFGDPWKFAPAGESAIYHNSTFTDSTESGSPAFLRNGYTWGITNN